MNNPYQLIVFDWEGTLSDTLGFILHTLLSEAKKLGFGEVAPCEARQVVDLGLIQALKKLFPDLPMQQQEQLLEAVHQAIISRPTPVHLIPGAREFIQQLHQAKIKLAIATNRGHHSLLQALQASGLAVYFKTTRSAGQTPPKPCPQMLEEIMEEMGESSSSTLMIGDSSADMEMAKSIHVGAIGFDFYRQQEEALRAAGALFVVDDYSLLARFLDLLPLLQEGDKQ